MIHTTGVRSFIGIVVNINNKRAGISVQDAQLLLDNASSAYYDESVGRLQLDPCGVYEVWLEPGSLDKPPGAIIKRAAALLSITQNIDVFEADVRVWFLPPIYGSGFGGHSPGGGDVFVYNNDLGSLLHEIGHDLGLDHTYNHHTEGGDSTSWMASSYYRKGRIVGLTAPELVSLGWMHPSNILDVRVGGTYFVLPLSHPFPKHYSQVYVVWSKDLSKQAYISFVGNYGNKKGLSDFLKNKIHVHIRRGNINSRIAVVDEDSRYKDSEWFDVFNEGDGNVYFDLINVGDPPPRELVEPLQIVTEPIIEIQADSPINIDLEASGGAGGYTWIAIGNGQFPPGVELYGGCIDGRPQVTGNFKQRIRVRDRNYNMTSKVFTFRVTL